jgi:hypothetical protein
METCNKSVKTVENQYRPCLCEIGHAGGCNPFSPNPYMGLAISKTDLPKGDRMPLPLVTPQFQPQPSGVVWTDKSTQRRCLWQGAHGRCIYEIGNHTEHKEEINGARDH